MPEDPKPSPFACDMSAIAPSERGQHLAAIAEVFGAVTEIRELPDGYSFRLPNDMVLKVADFIFKERLCCPFFGFALQVEPEGGALWLSLTGRDGVKPFIRAEIGHAVDAAVSWQGCSTIRQP
ncbi:MAG TPA: hypothetical protein VE078_19885 [Thermoanaerobaculia bacterium]|nr:hypothetical protein [Thermoanaerobaculia bacterium]